MTKKKRRILIVLGSFVLVGLFILAGVTLPELSRYLSMEPFDSRVEGVGIARRVEATPYDQGALDKIPKYKSSDASLDVFLMGADLRKLDLNGRLNDLLHSRFDTNTIWPEPLPNGFDPEMIMENGKDPGLNVRKLHEKGIDGRGVSIGIIDQTLLTGHQEYKDNLKHYEEIHLLTDDVQMHGAAVASLAVGRNVGVAPKADLYYITAGSFENGIGLLSLRWGLGFATHKYYVEAIDRLLDINELLPEHEKIRVISISWNTGSEAGIQNGDMGRAIKRAKEENVFVVSTSLERDYGYKISGLGKNPMGDPNDLDSYSVRLFQQRPDGSHRELYKNALFFPMDARAYASFTGEGDYSFDALGGWSWVCPYIAGLYALCAQVYPDITPEIFWENAMNTSDSLTVENRGKDFTIKHIVNPVKLVEAMQQL